MRHQPPYQSSPSQPGEVVPTSVKTSRTTQTDDRAVLLDRSADGAELEIRPIATSRGARWTRAETLLGLGLVAVLFGGALVNGLANALAEPKPTPASSDALIGEATTNPAKTNVPVPGTPRPTVAPTPAITPAVACGELVEGSGPPVVNLVSPGLDPIPGVVGAFTWFGAVSPPSQVHLQEGSSIPFEGEVELQIGGEICATRWTIQSVPAGQGETTVFELAWHDQGFSDWGSFTSNRSDNPVISQQNHMTVKPIGIGRVFVQAVLNFEGGHQAQVYWLIRIRAFDPPAIHVVGPDGTDVTPVVGCGVSVQMSDNWYGEECPSGSWPLLEDGPIITAHEGDLVRVEVPDWPLTTWGVRWVNQAEIRPGISEPNDLGNLYGYDSLKLTMFRWFVPPAGDYGVQIYLSHEQDTRTYSLPVHVRLEVLP